MRPTGTSLVILFVMIAVLQTASIAALLSGALPVWLTVTLKVALFASVGLFVWQSVRWVRRRLAEA